jgi:hypothetical protein
VICAFHLFLLQSLAATKSGPPTESRPAEAPVPVQQKYRKIVAKDCEQIYAILIEPSNAVDSSLVVQHLSAINCKSASDLEYFDEADFDTLLKMMKPGIPTKKLMKLLNP